MNLREQFKKETGRTWKNTGTDGVHSVLITVPRFEYVEWLEQRNKEQVEVLKDADQFITNGIELGYIRMPDEETGDSASETPKKIEQALKRAGCADE